MAHNASTASLSQNVLFHHLNGSLSKRKGIALFSLTNPDGYHGDRDDHGSDFNSIMGRRSRRKFRIVNDSRRTNLLTKIHRSSTYSGLSRLLNPNDSSSGDDAPTRTRHRRAQTPNIHFEGRGWSTSTGSFGTNARRIVYAPNITTINNSSSVTSPSPIPNTNRSNHMAHNSPFNPIEVASISIIVLLVISLFLYHCHKASEIESNLKRNGRNVVFRRTKIRRHHSFSRSASFASNLESVVEEPDIFDTRLADNKRQMEHKINNESPPFMEPWYKWLQQDSPRNNAQSLHKNYQSEGDLNDETDIDLEKNAIHVQTKTQIVNQRTMEFEAPIKSYLITMSKRNSKCHEQNGRQRSLSFDSYF
eukprot:6318_1